MSAALDRKSLSFGTASMLLGTSTGRMVDPLHMVAEDLDIEDIASALSKQCRFAGHTNQFYSVAQHCITVTTALHAYLTQMDVRPRSDLLLMGLLHDASEAYLVDLPTPIKRRMPAYMNAEKTLQSLIYKTFVGKEPTQQEVEYIKMADGLALHAEAHDLMTRNTWINNIGRPSEYYVKKIKPLTPPFARMLFIKSYRTLTKYAAN